MNKLILLFLLASISYAQETNTRLTDLKDVNIRYPSAGQIIRWRSGQWVNEAMPSGTGGTSDHSALSNLGYAASGHTGFAATAHNHSLANITDWGDTSLTLSHSNHTHALIDSLNGFDITGTTAEISVTQTGVNQHQIGLPDSIYTDIMRALRVRAGTLYAGVGGLKLLDSGSDNYLTLSTSDDLDADYGLTFVTGNSNRSITLSGNPTLGDWFDQSVKSTASPTFVNLSLTSMATNWTNAGRTIADLGIVTTADINGGTIDGVTIGGASAGAGTFTTIASAAASGNTLAMETSGLVYDATNNRVGIGTASPSYSCEVVGATFALNSQATNGVFRFIGHATNGRYPAFYFSNESAVTKCLMVGDVSLGSVYFDYTGTPGSGTGTFNIRNNINGSGATTALSCLANGNVNIGANLGLGQTTWGTSAAKVFAIGNGTAPSTAPADAIQTWSADYAAGDARLYLKTESGTANIVLGNDQIVVSSLLKCVITVGGSVTARTFTVNVVKFDGVAPTSMRVLVKWWVSTSEYGAAGTVANQTYEVTTGQELYNESTAAENHACTDASGNMVLTITNAQTGAPTAMYFHCEVQGIVYTANGTLNMGTTK